MFPLLFRLAYTYFYKLLGQIWGDDEKEALEYLKKLEGIEWAKEALEDASIHTLVDGELDTEFSPSYIAKQMGW